MASFTKEEMHGIIDQLSQHDAQMQSLLSPFVLEIIQDSKCEQSEEALSPDGFLHWQKIYDTLDKAGYPKDPLFHKAVVKALSPSVTYIYDTYKGCSMNCFWEKYGEYFDWTGNKELFVHVFNHLEEHMSGVSSALALLLLTSAIERALGNVFLVKGRVLPFLLKDLLSTDELKEIFGEREMALINTFLGIPTSLNLRNIMWHGFVSPSEIDQRYGYFLMVLTMSLGMKLQEKNIKELSFRPFVSFEKTSVLEKVFPDLGEKEILQLKNIYMSSYAIPNCMKPYWTTVLHLYQQKWYGNSMALLLPQLETCLRVIFAAVNDCPQRALTAEPDARYVTLTEIFSEFLEDGKPNKFSKDFTESEMELLMDVFVFPEGPRIRDRLSHGEADFLSTPQHLVKHVLCIAAVICLKFVKNCDELVSESQFADQLRASASTYQSFFHPVSLLRDKVSLFIQDLKAWDKSQVHMPEVCGMSDESCPDYFHNCIALACVAYKLPSSLSSRWEIFSDGLDKHDELLKTSRISVIHRPKTEAELTAMLRKITYHSLEASSNVQLALTTYYTFWRDKSLRSRQRTTYARLLKSVFIIYAGLRALLIVLIGHTININSICCWMNSKGIILKILKLSQKYAENLHVMSETRVNRWEESSRSTSEFIEKLSSYFMQLEVWKCHS